jgi:threonine dehydratase
MKALGANVILVDGEIETALETATQNATETGAFLVEDSKDIGTCEGAATIGVELADLPGELDSVLVSLGAGAMASGVGFALKSWLLRVESARRPASAGGRRRCRGTSRMPVPARSATRGDSRTRS